MRHQYLQLLLRQIAEKLGYRAGIETTIPNSQQRVDVLITGHDTTIACEIPISTKYREYRNLRKCFDAGYQWVVSVALDRETLNFVRARSAYFLTPNEKERTRFFFPEELEEFLKNLAAQLKPANGEKIIRGYRVRVTYETVSPEEVRTRRMEIAGVIARMILSDQAKKAKSSRSNLKI